MRDFFYAMSLGLNIAALSVYFVLVATPLPEHQQNDCTTNVERLAGAVNLSQLEPLPIREHKQRLKNIPRPQSKPDYIGELIRTH